MRGNDRYVHTTKEIEPTLKELVETYKLIRGSEVIDHIPEDYQPGTDAISSIMNFFNSIGKIEGKIPAFDRDALVIGIGHPRTTIYDNIKDTIKTYPGSIYKIAVKQSYIPKKVKSTRGPPSKFYVKGPGFDASFGVYMSY